MTVHRVEQRLMVSESLKDHPRSERSQVIRQQPMSKNDKTGAEE